MVIKLFHFIVLFFRRNIPSSQEFELSTTVDILTTQKISISGIVSLSLVLGGYIFDTF